ncbi:MAG: FAD-dependent oxidoreductase [Candidatus Fimimonas sp.]
MSNTQQESNRCLHCKNPQCKQGCPVGYDIPAFLRQVSQNDFYGATKTVGHLFGEICGSVCPREKQCKGNCVLGKRNCAIDVGAVEREVFQNNCPVLSRQSNQLRGVKIAVVGGGVSGITFATQCYKAGAEVTVFERAQLLHTIKSIPSFRLPKQAISRIESAVKNSEIAVVKQNVSATDVENLQKTFHAVYLATGVSVANKMYVSGEELATQADDFLREDYFGNVIVVGGGNTAMDCARLNVFRGGKSTVAYRRSRADMPAFDSEVESALAENVQFLFNVAPLSVEKTGDKLTVTFAETVSEGRGKLTLTEKRVTLTCDKLVVATGNKFDVSVYPAERYVAVDEQNLVCGNLYAGGDAVGKSLVAQAVADGINAAQSVLKRFGK